MKYNVISYLIGEGIRNVFKNKKSTISALTVMFLCMLIFGIFFIIGENISNIMNTVEEAQGFSVFFNLGTSQERISEVGEQIRTLEGIKKVEFVSGEESLNSYKEDLKDKAGALAGMEENFLPDAYKVTLSDLSLNEQIQEKIKAIVGSDLEEIISGDEQISVIMNIGKGIRLFTFALLIILVLFALVIISNTIKLSVHARRKEISIMKYVGATNSFIRWPFIVEGMIIGVVAALVAVLVVGLGYNAIIPSLSESSIIQELEITFVSFNDMFNLLMIVYFVLGIGIGVIGSSISMKRYLEV